MVQPFPISRWRKHLACIRLALMRITLALALITVSGHVYSLNSSEPTRTEINVSHRARAKRTVSYKFFPEVSRSTPGNPHSLTERIFRLLQHDRIVTVRHKSTWSEVHAFHKLNKWLRVVYSPEKSDDLHATHSRG